MSPPSSPTRATIDLEDGTVVGSWKSTGDLASSDSESSRENVDAFHKDTASGDCISCSDTDDAAVQMVHTKYQGRVQASCRLSKCIHWNEAQLKSIGKGHQHLWEHDHKSIRTEWDNALLEDCNSFEM